MSICVQQTLHTTTTKKKKSLFHTQIGKTHANHTHTKKKNLKPITHFQTPYSNQASSQPYPYRNPHVLEKKTPKLSCLGPPI